MAQKVLTLDALTGKKKLIEIAEGVNFSFKEVQNGETVAIPARQQMIVVGQVNVFGQLNVLGEMVMIDLIDEDTSQVIPPADPENFSHVKVNLGITKIVPQDQQMNVIGSLKVFGELQMLGEITLLKPFQIDDPDLVPVIPGDNFSHKEIATLETKTVPTRQQMIVSGALKIHGQLNLNGEVVLISPRIDEVDDYLPPYLIEEGESYTINKNRLMFIPRQFNNFGELKNFGLLTIGSA